MSNHIQPSFDHEATLEELAGVGKNRRFDALIDDDEFEELQVICRRGEEEIPLAKPSRAFYFGDRNLYDQEAKRFDQAEKARILNTDQFRGNVQVFEELKRACQRGFVIPFVGAGMSKSVGLPEWKEYLLGLCDDAGLSRDALRERLETQSDYEGAMNEIVQRLTINRFERDFERSFQVPEFVTGAVTLLPKLFDCSAITTNFDRVLEQVYLREGKPFAEKVTGRGKANAFFRAIPAGERYLLKLHGNIDNATERVLNQSEYHEAYGQDADDGEHLGVPAEDQRVILLEHLRAALAQFLDLRVERARDDADEAGHDDEAADGDDEHEDAEAPAAVAAHGSRVERAHEVAPQDVAEAALRVIVGSLAEDGHDHADDQHQDDGGDAEQGHEREGSSRHPVVEPIAEALGEGRLVHGSPLRFGRTDYRIVAARGCLCMHLNRAPG